MSNNSIPPSKSNPLGSIETKFDTNEDPYYSIESDEEQQQKQQEEEPEKPEEEETRTVPVVPVNIWQHIDQVKEYAPKDQEEFYLRSYQIFAKLNDCVKDSDPNNITDSKKSEISIIVIDYIDLVHEYPRAAKLRPIWDLASRLYFPTEYSDLIRDLNDWINEYDPILDHTKDEEYDEGEDDYSWVWETIRRHLLRGNFHEAVKTLNTALIVLDENEVSALKTIIELVQEFKALQQHRDKSYTYEWTRWHNHCEYKLKTFMEQRDEANNFRQVDEEIRMIYSILFGDEASIFFSGTYYERVLGSILYSRPAITISGLNTLAQTAISDDGEVDICAYILMGCFDDLFEACNDLWLQTHLGHALIAIGAKATYTVESSKNSEDHEAIIDPIYYCIDGYAHMVAENNDMWTEAAHYISACVENREIWIKKLLGDPPLKSKGTDDLESILDIATQENMPGIEKYIHRAMGQRYEDNKDIIQATIEYGEAQDLESLDRFAHEEFGHYLKSGTLHNVVADMQELKASPHYAVLMVYQQLRTHLEKKEWEEASKLVLELLKSKKLPSKFETVLLIDNLVILEERKQYYNQKEMLQLLNVFKQATQDTSNEELFCKYYTMIRQKNLSGSVVIAKLRERMAYKALVASA